MKQKTWETGVEGGWEGEVVGGVEVAVEYELSTTW